MSGEQPRVLFCSFDVIPEPTGTSARTTGWLRALEGRANADALTVKLGEHGHIERYCGARLMRVPVGPGDLPTRAQAFERAVRRQLESDEYQLVHFTDPFGGYALCEMRAQHRFKLVYEVVGLPSVEVRYTHPHLEGDRRFMARLRRQELFCLMNADAVLVGSEQTASMVQGLGVSRERMAVMPAQVDLADYPEQVLAPPDRDPMRVVYLGGQQTWQGLGTLVFAVAIAARSAPLKLVIVGPQNPGVRLELDEAIEHRRLTGVVDFLAPVPEPELATLLAACDLGAAPLEKSERNTVQGAPISKIARYLAAGRPVIASDLPVVRGICGEECTAFHRPGDEGDLARRLVELSRDPARRAAMGARARALALATLSAERGQARLVDLYAGLLGEAGPRFRSAPLRRDRDLAPDAPTPSGQAALDATPSGLPKLPGDETDAAAVAPAFDERSESPLARAVLAAASSAGPADRPQEAVPLAAARKGGAASSPTGDVPGPPRDPGRAPAAGSERAAAPAAPGTSGAAPPPLRRGAGPASAPSPLAPVAALPDRSGRPIAAGPAPGPGSQGESAPSPGSVAPPPAAAPPGNGRPVGTPAISSEGAPSARAAAAAAGAPIGARAGAAASDLAGAALAARLTPPALPARAGAVAPPALTPPRLPSPAAAPGATASRLSAPTAAAAGDAPSGLAGATAAPAATPSRLTAPAAAPGGLSTPSSAPLVGPPTAAQDTRVESAAAPPSLPARRAPAASPGSVSGASPPGPAAGGSGGSRGTAAPGSERRAPATDPIPVDAEDVEPIASGARAGATPAAASAEAEPRALTPQSGTPPPDEWMGHLLFGYAPFGVPFVRPGGGNGAGWVGQARARAAEEPPAENPKREKGD